MILSHSNFLAALAMAAANLPSSTLAAVPADMSNPDLPWQNLMDALSTEATILPASNQDYIDQCSSEVALPLEERDYTRDQNQPSGLCVFGFSCGYENCFPNGVEDFDNWEALNDAPFLQDTYLVEPLENLGLLPFEEWLDPSLPTFNVPSSVLFPAVAGDVVAAVRFARDHGLELSVKASGHHYAGASSKKDTLLVNTMRYKKYSPTGLVECATNDITSPKFGDVDQVCSLAMARGTKAFIRVGGGENWGHVYGSVKEFNEAQENYKYMAIGGSDRTVTPMGWTMQGGLSGTAGGRIFGMGVDQVLQIEAVLPNGQHVRFGPSSWESEEGFRYPRTTAVSGMCNTNPEEDEEQWEWESCPMEINFDDLWFAFRGGGGGSYGIVTSIYLQLQDYLPLEFVGPGNCYVQWVESGLMKAFLIFFLEYMLEPHLLGVSPEDSNACGRPFNSFNSLVLYCYGEGTGMKMASTWKSYLQNKTEELLSMGVLESDIAVAGECLESNVFLDFKDFLDVVATDPPPPTALFNNEAERPSTIYKAVVPVSAYIALKSTFLDKILDADIGGAEYGYLILYMALGGGVPFAHDQTTSVSESYRQAAFMIILTASQISEMGLDALTGTAMDASDIPGFMGGNHYSPFNYGPLKSDLTKACPLSFSTKEVEENCYPTQVGVWGSKNLARLEKIKEEIDPNHMLDCNTCVGNNRIKNQEPSHDDGHDAHTEDHTSHDKDHEDEDHDSHEDGDDHDHSHGESHDGEDSAANGLSSALAVALAAIVAVAY